MGKLTFREVETLAVQLVHGRVGMQTQAVRSGACALDCQARRRLSGYRHSANQPS